jgi:hypothetical protein
MPSFERLYSLEELFELQRNTYAMPDHSRRGLNAIGTDKSPCRFADSSKTKRG